MRNSSLYSFIFIVMLLPVLAHSQDWTLKTTKNGISIYERKTATSKFQEIRAEMDLPAGSLNKLAATLANIGGYPGWAYSTRSASVVKPISKTEFIYYCEIEFPWPATNRDMYANFRITRDSASHSFIALARGMPNYAAANPKMVRVPVFNCEWRASILSNRQVHLQYTLQFDPGGDLPAWILNLFANKGPMETFAGLRKEVGGGE